MAGKMTLMTFALFAMLHFEFVLSNPAIVTANKDPREVCIENCAQCVSMLGAWFKGPLCAEACLKYEGKLIPDCEDIKSIKPFLNTPIQNTF